MNQPSIGLILCKSKNQLIAEYALRDTGNPIGISEYQLTQSLPSNIAHELPAIEEIESELRKSNTLIGRNKSCNGQFLLIVTH